MRREPALRNENQVALALAEIERIKALLNKITDGRRLVIDTGSGVGDTTPPVEAAQHVLYGSKHTRSLSVTAGAGLNINFEQGQIWMAGVFYSIAAGSLAMTDATTNYVFVNSAGAVASNTTGFPSASVPLATVVTAGGAIVSVNDRRSYLASGVHGAGITIGNPLAVGVDDTTQGIFRAWGQGAGFDPGGQLELFLSADHDAVFQAWYLRADQDDLRVLTSTASVDFRFRADGELWIGAAAGALQIGGDVRLSRGAADRLTLESGDDFYIVNGEVGVGVEPNVFGDAMITVAPNAATRRGILIFGAPAQSGDYIRVLNSAGQPLFTLSSDGDIAPARLVLSRSVSSVPVSLSAPISVLVSGSAPNQALTVHFEIENESGGTGTSQWRWGRASNVPDLDTIWFLGDGTNNPVMQLDHTNGRLLLLKEGIAAGLIIGGDVQLYRSAANTLRTPDSLIIDEALRIGSYARVGSTAAPVNVTAGDLTVDRLLVGDDGVLGSDRKFQVRYASAIAPAAGGLIGGSINLISAPAAATGDAIGLLVDHLIRPTAANASIHQALKFSISHDSGAFDLTGTGFGGVQGESIQNVAGTTISDAFGLRGLIRAQAGTITTGRVFDARLGFAGDAGAFGTLVGFDVADIDVPVGGIGTAIGFRTRNLGAAGVTDAIGVDVAAQAGASGLNIGIRNAGSLLQTGVARFDTAVDINAQVNLSANLVLDATSVISTLSKARQSAGDQFIDLNFTGLVAGEDARIRVFRSTVPQGADDRFTIFVPNTATVAMEVFANTQRISLPGTGSGAGILIGGDVQLYRSAADVLTIPDQLILQQQTLGNEVFRAESVATNDDPSERLLQNRVATTDATVTTLHTYTIPASTTVFLEAHVTARRTGGVAGAVEDGTAYIRRAAIKNVAGVATIIGAVQDAFTAEDQAAWDCTIDVTAATARVRVTGALDNNVTWHLSALRTWQVST